MEEWGSLNIITVHRSHFYPEMPEEELEKMMPLNDDAVAAIKAMPGVAAVSPSFWVHGEVRKGRETGYIQFVGIDPDLMEPMEFEAAAGRLLNVEDRFNAVAGYYIMELFMGPGGYEQTSIKPESPTQTARDPMEILDQRLILTLFNARGQKRRYTLNVVGVLGSQSREHGYSIYLPLNIIRQMHGFVNQGAQQAQFEYIEPGFSRQKQEIAAPQRPVRQEIQYDFITVRAKDVETTKRLSEELRNMGYMAHSVADELEGIEQGTRTVQAILGGIGAISLLVAAIGIINTMVISIYERTKEIAVFKVLGASFSNIRWLFLVESSLIGFLGGASGLALSYLLSLLINLYGGAFIGGGMAGAEAQQVQISLIPIWLSAFALVFGAAIGMIAGLYPAIRAMRLDPVTAMRHY